MRSWSTVSIAAPRLAMPFDGSERDELSAWTPSFGGCRQGRSLSSQDGFDKYGRTPGKGIGG